MDNVTHTLIGVTFARALPKRFQRPSIYWASVIGNNLPDSDFIYRLFPQSTGLDYLIHHRGYTHTFLAALPLGLLTALIAKKLGREKSWDPWLIVIAVIASCMHIGADFLNNYGVHPFSPFWNHWFYGDAFFIVEPMLWFAMIPFAAQCANRTWSRRTWWVFFVFMLTLIWFSPQSSPVTAWIGSAFALIIYGVQHFTRSRCVPVTSIALILATFFTSSHWVKNKVQHAWHESVQGKERLSDLDSVPLPGNPICWRSWINSQDEKHYISRAAVVSLWPSFIHAEKCPMVQTYAQTAPVTLPLLPSDVSLLWAKQYDITIDQFESLRKESCTLRRLLTFVRSPFIKVIDPQRMIAGDLRYDREEGLGFTEVEIQLPDTCDKGEPWLPPFYRKM